MREWWYDYYYRGNGASAQEFGERNIMMSAVRWLCVYIYILLLLPPLYEAVLGRAMKVVGNTHRVYAGDGKYAWITTYYLLPSSSLVE